MTSAQAVFRDFIDNGGEQLTAGLDTAIKALPVTSADAKRGFSTMNIINTDIRSRLLVPRLAKLMFVSLVIFTGSQSDNRLFINSV